MKILDISHVLNENTPFYQNDSALSLTKYRSLEKDFYTSYKLNTGLHTGTHIDMPMHLTPDTRTAADFPADCFFGRGVLLDVRGETVVSMKPHYLNLVFEGAAVLLYTGFDEKYYEPEYFNGHPEVGEQLTDFFIKRKIKILGMDIPSPDYPPYSCHKALLSNGIFILENLANLRELLTVTDFDVCALPLKLAAEASQTRAVVFIR